MQWRQGSTAVAVAVAFLVLGACGGGSSDGDEGPDDDVAAEAGDDAGGGGSGGTGDDDAGGDDGGSPPTAGPGEAGLFTGPSGAEDPEPDEVVIYGCGDIHAPNRLEKQEYEELLDELQCIFDNAHRMPREAIAEAEQAADMARFGIEQRDASTTTTTTGPETTEPTPVTTEPATTEPTPVTTEPATTEPAPVVDPETATTTSG
jgi:hypothetical protein